MERLVHVEGPINDSLYEEHLGLDCLGNSVYFNNNIERLKLEEEEAEPSYQKFDDYNMSFLQMLQSPPVYSFTEPNFQTLLRLQHMKKEKPCEVHEMGEIQIQGLELESCVTQDVMEELHSPLKSDIKSCAPADRKKRKRKRKKQTNNKNKEEAESQRMTHIAVERNRRRQMNDHLTALRSLMPTSYIQRGHQASIVGGAIDFVKELEQMLNSLEARKQMRLVEEGVTSPPNDGDGWSEVTVKVVEELVNLKVRCRRRRGQLVRAIVALEEELRLTVLHLDISSVADTVLYSFNLKIENDCGVGSEEHIAAAVQQIFSITDAS